MTGFKMHFMLSKKAYFFIIDALIASLILAALIMALFKVGVKQGIEQPTIQQRVFDIEHFLMSTKVNQISQVLLPSMVDPSSKLWHYSLAQYYAYFLLQNNFTEQAIQNVSQSLNSVLSTSLSGLNINISINNTQVLFQGSTNLELADNVFKSSSVVVLEFNNSLYVLPFSILAWR